MDVFVKKFGIESLFLDAADLVVDKAFKMAIEKDNLTPVVEPKVMPLDINKDKIVFKFTIITKPQVEIKKYKDLKVKRDKVKVTKEEINHEIEHLLEHYAELEIKDGEASLGDTLIIDYEGTIDGVKFDGGSSENYSLVLGSNTFIPGFEEQLVGAKKEEERDVKVTFPADYHAKDLQGKEAVFKVKVHEIKVKKNRSLDKEFFEDLALPGVDSKETLEENIKEHLLAHKTTDAENKFVDDMMEAISKNTVVDIPDEMIEEEVTNLLKRAEENLKYQGITLDLYYEFTKTTEADLRKQLESEAHKNVLYRLILEEVMKLEDIKATDKDIDKEIKDMASKYNAKEEDIIKELGGRDMIKYDVEVHKTFDKLAEYNEVKEK